MPHVRSTLRLTMPEPPSSIQPEPPHVRHGSALPQVSSPWQAKQRKSVSMLGSVNGK